MGRFGIAQVNGVREKIEACGARLISYGQKTHPCQRKVMTDSDLRSFGFPGCTSFLQTPRARRIPIPHKTARTVNDLGAHVGIHYRNSGSGAVAQKRISGAENRIPYGQNIPPDCKIIKTKVTSEPHEGKTGDILEVADVEGGYSIAKDIAQLTDQQVFERNPYAFSFLLAFDTSSQPRDVEGDGMHGHVLA